MNWDYKYIKQLAKDTGSTIKDYIVLSQQNDPFYAGTETDNIKAKWFADLWQKYNYGTGVHLRRIHYQIISQETPVMMHDGLRYENTDKCWSYLASASQKARYLNLVDPKYFDDRRASKPVINYKNEGDYLYTDVDSIDEGFNFDFPDMPELPNYSLYINVDQPYQVEIWTEKSTMNDILVPLCQKYHVNLVTGIGEISITQAVFLINRLTETNKPCRICYISDFDPAGRSMPVAAARKIEYFLRNQDNDFDVQLDPIVLTPEQCKEYKLPRTPIKDTELRSGKFEQQHGEGATELDALEALYPGELKKIIQNYILEYYSESLQDKVENTSNFILNDLGETRNDIINGTYGTRYSSMVKEYDDIKNKFQLQVESFGSRLADLYREIEQDLKNKMPNYDEGYLPEIEKKQANGMALYNSKRDYKEQLTNYKHFQNGT